MLSSSPVIITSEVSNSDENCDGLLAVPLAGGAGGGCGGGGGGGSGGTVGSGGGALGSSSSQSCLSVPCLGVLGNTSAAAASVVAPELQR